MLHQMQMSKPAPHCHRRRQRAALNSSIRTGRECPQIVAGKRESLGSRILKFTKLSEDGLYIHCLIRTRLVSAVSVRREFIAATTVMFALSPDDGYDCLWLRNPHNGPQSPLTAAPAPNLTGRSRRAWR